MSRLLETIKIANGKICNIAYHNKRLNVSRKACFDSKDAIDLNDHIMITDFHSTGLYKCRVLYQDTIEVIELHKYQIRPINSVKLVHHDSIDYSYKYENRTELSELFSNRGEADDILIIRDGFVTDSYYCNVAFRDSDGHWRTPATPLLHGTKRRQLLDNGLISEQDIRIDDLPRFSEVSLFNSMIELGEVRIPIQNILTD